MLRGEILQFAVPILYVANECAIRKKDGGIWPIAVGSIIRILSVKVGSSPVVQAPGRRAETGPVGGLNVWGMGGGSSCSPTLSQGLWPQKGPSED